MFVEVWLKPLNSDHDSLFAACFYLDIMYISFVVCYELCMLTNIFMHYFLHVMDT